MSYLISNFVNATLKNAYNLNFLMIEISFLFTFFLFFQIIKLIIEMSSIIIKINNNFRILSLIKIDEIDFHFKLASASNNVNIDNLFKNLNDFSMNRFFDFHEKISKQKKINII